MKFKQYFLTEKFAKADRMKQRFGRHEDKVAYINLHKNPDHDEVLEIINDFKASDPELWKLNGEMDFVRGDFDDDENLYVWYGSFFHDNVFAHFRISNPSINIRFAWIKGDKFLTVESTITSHYFQKWSGDTPIKKPVDIEYDKLSKIQQKRADRLLNAFPMTVGNSGVPVMKKSLRAWITDQK